MHHDRWIFWFFGDNFGGTGRIDLVTFLERLSSMFGKCGTGWGDIGRCSLLVFTSLIGKGGGTSLMTAFEKSGLIVYFPSACATAVLISCFAIHVSAALTSFLPAARTFAQSLLLDSGPCFNCILLKSRSSLSDSLSCLAESLAFFSSSTICRIGVRSESWLALDTTIWSGSGTACGSICRRSVFLEVNK
jgi:hypothetical protein